MTVTAATPTDASPPSGSTSVSYPLSQSALERPGYPSDGTEATPSAPWARFDDLRSGQAWLCPPAHHYLQALREEDVADVLREVHDWTERGSWAFGYVSYEAAAGLDSALPGGWAPGQPPLAWFGVCDEPSAVPTVEAHDHCDQGGLDWRPDWTASEYERAVDLVRGHIAAGEAYQCNLTDRFHNGSLQDPGTLYRQLALAQRGAYNAYLDLGEHVIVSASPELFFDWAGDVIRTRPMKGTMRRGRTTNEDRDRVRDLRSSTKERAENLMIVDLIRNDLGRVAQTGTVRVDELFSVEKYPTVWQMTSRVSARLRTDVGLVDLFRALFPCGSVTGAPKRRAMQLIAELEPTPRGIYCGAIGLVAPPGNALRARFSVAIRTAHLDRNIGRSTYGAGGAITWDSDAAQERAEVHAKAAVLRHDATDHQLIETLAYTPTRGLRNLHRHLTRLADSADYFDFECDLDAVRDAVRGSVHQWTTPARVQVLLSRNGQVNVALSPMPPPGRGHVRLVVDDQPVDAVSLWLQHKTTRRDVYRRCALRHPQADDVVILNRDGELTETTTANLAVHLDGRWWTPPTNCGCLPGVERGRLLDLGHLHERILRSDDLLRADRLAVVNSLRGWRPAELADASTRVRTAISQRIPGEAR
jgi:para-aminobenzoate synthetase/4-amino-4-deoxychorismate lyase